MSMFPPTHPSNSWSPWFWRFRGKQNWAKNVWLQVIVAVEGWLSPAFIGTRTNSELAII